MSWDARLRRAKHALSVRLVQPACRAWAKHVLGDRPADPLYELLGAFVFWEVHDYWPRFRSPRTFSEKLWHRGLYDRDPRLTLLSDKLRSRDYIIERLGDEVLPRLLWTGTDPRAIPFDALPDRFVVKTNHGCGYNVLVDDKRRLAPAAVRAQVGAWLRENYCEAVVVGMEWGYKNVRPAILVEEYLGGDQGPPADYKFHCYEGRAWFIQVNEGRLREPREGIFDRDFNRLPVRFQCRWSYEGDFTRPENFDDMVRVAERLAAELPFVRVDLYSVGGRVYVGELTCYPTGGVVRFESRAWDEAWGEPWPVDASPRR